MSSGAPSMRAPSCMQMREETPPAPTHRHNPFLTATLGGTTVPSIHGGGEQGWGRSRGSRGVKWTPELGGSLCASAQSTAAMVKPTHPRESGSVPHD